MYVFGSVVRGEVHGFNGIDIFIVTEKIDEKYEIIVEVYKEVKVPVEL